MLNIAALQILNKFLLGFFSEVKLMKKKFRMIKILTFSKTDKTSYFRLLLNPKVKHAVLYIFFFVISLFKNKSIKEKPDPLLKKNSNETNIIYHPI